MKKYLIESLLIFVSVLSAFVLESIRLEQSKIKLKNDLLIELKSVIKEDLIQIEKVTTVLNESFKSSIILRDDFLSKRKLSNEVVAKEFAKLRFMNISYFPQNGVFNQLLNTGSLELIGKKELKKKLMYTYEHLNKRKSGNDFILDEMTWRNFQKLSDQIYVVSQIQEHIEFNNKKKFIFTDSPIKTFFISNRYYESNKVIQFYAQIGLLMKQYKDLIEEIVSEYNKIIIYIEDELKDGK